MKHLFTFALWFAVLTGMCLSPRLVQAQPGEAAHFFQEGNSLYQEGDYNGALKAYARVLENGYESGALYFNMGNAYYRLDQVGQAVRHYERARRFMPANNRLRHNLILAQRRAPDSFAQRPTPAWQSWWERAVAQVGARGFFLGGLIPYLMATALLGWRIVKGPFTLLERGLFSASLSVAGLLLVASFAASLEPVLRPRAVITAKEAALHQEARPSAPADQTLHEGLLLDVLHADSAWVRVRLPDGQTGWLRSETVVDL